MNMATMFEFLLNAQFGRNNTNFRIFKWKKNYLLDLILFLFDDELCMHMKIQ